MAAQHAAPVLAHGQAASDEERGKPTTRGAAIAAYCRGCIYDSAAAGTWREQVAVCSSLACALWRFRPLPRHAPAWITSRDAADMPAGWIGLHQGAAVARLRAGSSRMAAKPGHPSTIAPDPTVTRRGEP